MKIVFTDLNSLNVETAFSRQAQSFDKLYSGNAIIGYKRRRVREHLARYMLPESAVLDLNSGTGEDAIHLARLGHKVHATDLSEGMQLRLRAKVDELRLNHLISTELCSFTQLSALKSRGPYDHILSNFGGLNCTGKLDNVLQSLPQLVKPGGTVTLVIISKFCIWEALLILRGKFKTASRRWFRRDGARAHIEGVYFNCWYYDPSYIIHHTRSSFDLLEVEGLCSLVPPSYIENFAEKYPRIYRFLESAEDTFKSKFPWKYWGDYFIISLRKK